MSQKERWATRLGLVLAMAGNAVGLGNFLRFPAQAAKNGGGAFLIPYIVALLLMGIPLMWVEWTMGRYGGHHGHHSAPGIFQSMGRSRLWKYFGAISLWSVLVIASYYLYIESWCISYAFYSFLGGFRYEAAPDFFDRLTGTVPNQIWAFSPWGMAIFFACISLNIWLLSQGLVKGIETVAKIGMPLLILFGGVLAVRGMFIDPATDSAAVASPLVGLNFVWQPKLDSLSNPSVWLAAAGQIFFTLSIGMGSIHCYASYLRMKDDVALTGMTTAWTNEFCEVVLGSAILIPIAVAYLGLEEVQSKVAGGSGFGLGFMVFPSLIDKWGAFAPFAGFLWFGLLFFAAITSSLAMGQPIMAFLQTEFGFSRERSALALGALVLALALPVALFHENTFNADFDFWAGTFMLVVFALGETILFAWVFGMDRGWEQLNYGAEIQVPRFFYFIIKYVTPVFITLILIGFVFQPRGTVRPNPSAAAAGTLGLAAAPIGPAPLQAVTGYVAVEQMKQDQGWEPYVKALFGGPAPPAWEWSGGGMIGKLLHEDVPALRPNASLEARQFDADLKFWRTIARLVLVGTYIFFALLVWKAWQRRQAEGGAA